MNDSEKPSLGQIDPSLRRLGQYIDKARDREDPLCSPATLARIKTHVQRKIAKAASSVSTITRLLLSGMALTGVTLGAAAAWHKRPVLGGIDSSMSETYRALPRSVREASGSATIAPLTPAPGAPQSGDQTIVYPAQAFVESLGINTRLAQQPALFPIVRQRLTELGLRHIIDEHDIPAALVAELHQRGIGTTLFVPPGGDITPLLVQNKNALDGLVLTRYRRETPRWETLQRQWTLLSRQRLLAFPDLSGLPLIGPTISDPERRATLGDISDLVDAGAIGSPSWNTPPGGAELETLMHAYRSSIYPGTEPLIVPQALYAGLDGSTELPEAHQARYLVRTYLENFRAGIRRTFGSHIIDSAPNPANFSEALGITRYGGTPKAAFFALRDLIAALADTGPAPIPQPVRLDLHGGGPDLRQLIFETAAGRRIVALWLDVPASDDPVQLAVRVQVGANANATWQIPGQDNLVQLIADAQGFVAVPVSENAGLLGWNPVP